MSHCVSCREFDVKESKDEITRYINDYVSCEDYLEGCSGLYNPIRWFDNEVMDDEEKAKEFLRRHDNGDYDNLAVKFYAATKEPTSKKLEAFNSKLLASHDKYYKLKDGFYYKNAKANYVTCKKCGSKINIKRWGKNICPVCRMDLRPESEIEKERKAKAAYEKAKKDLDGERKRLEKVAKNKKMMWLVKFEYHV